VKPENKGNFNCDSNWNPSFGALETWYLKTLTMKYMILSTFYSVISVFTPEVFVPKIFYLNTSSFLSLYVSSSIRRAAFFRTRTYCLSVSSFLVDFSLFLPWFIPCNVADVLLIFHINTFSFLSYCLPFSSFLEDFSLFLPWFIPCNVALQKSS
jgi:hypothetical protein